MPYLTCLIFFHRPPRQPNMLILHDQPRARIHKEFINQGVVRADPVSYLQYYGSEVDSWRNNPQYAHLIDEASRSLPPPPIPPPAPYYPPASTVSSAWDRMRYASPDLHSYPSPVISSAWDRMRAASPDLHSYPSPVISSAWDRMRSSSPVVLNAWDRIRSASTLPYATSYPYSDAGHLSSYHSYNDYGGYGGDPRSMSSVPPTWDRNFQSSVPGSQLPTYQFSSSSTGYPERTIRVQSDHELQNVLTDLTSGRVPSPLRSY